MSESIIALDARLISRDSTGDSTYWLGLVHGLAAIPHDFRFLLFSNDPKPLTIPNHPRFEWIHLPSRSERWWSLARFPLAARRHRARAIHTQYSLSPLAGPFGITTIHDVSFLIAPEWFRPKDRALLAYSVPTSAHRARAVITVSNTSCADIRRHVPAAANKIAVTPLAAHPWIQPIDSEVARRTVQETLGLDQPFALVVGTRWPRKNVQLALDAIEALPVDLPHVLAVTGKKGWGEEHRGHRVFETGYVSWDVLCALYSAADVYLIPSRYEGFGITALEAFRCGTPVISSQGGALPEVCGEAALMMPNYDAGAWGRAIQNLLRSPGEREDLRLRGLARERQFTWEKTAAATLKVYTGATL
ncbi:MAG: glycosyltransferase family 4 protein [Fimbriimonadaceae bacterium]